MAQLNLFGDEIPDPESRESKAGGECDRRCLEAREPKCVCRCGGRNHGYLTTAANTNLDGEARYLQLDHIPEISGLFDFCLVCGGRQLEIMGYPHPDGIHVENYKMRLWVFGRCLRCGYDNALGKYSLPRAQAIMRRR